jgi:hypothetical protein
VANELVPRQYELTPQGVFTHTMAEKWLALTNEERDELLHQLRQRSLQQEPREPTELDVRPWVQP